MRRLILILLAVAGAFAVSGAPAEAARAQAAPHDLTIVAPQALTLAAPPDESPLGTVTYGLQATLLQAEDNATAIPEGTKKPMSPGRGYRWIGLKVELTNTGSQDTAVPVPLMTGTDGQHYFGSDATMPGCHQLATFPPRMLAPGRTFIGCDTYALPDKVAPSLATVNMGFANPAATGFWQLSARPLAKLRFPVSYAALGDSYSSGEGAGDYDAKLAHCHRSANAWPRLVASDLPHLITMRYGALIACSGATSMAFDGDVEGQPDQVALLRDLSPAPGLLTITMGGNDIGFPNILQNCVLTLGGCIADGRLARAENDIEHEGRTLVADYRLLQAAGKGATILVVGYPRLFPQDQGDVVASCAAWLSDDVRASLNQLDADLNAVIHTAAVKAGLRFADVTGALNQHEGCTAHSWLYPIVRPFQQQSGHPTKPGQQAIAAIVRAYLQQF